MSKVFSDKRIVIYLPISYNCPYSRIKTTKLLQENLCYSFVSFYIARICCKLSYRKGKSSVSTQFHLAWFKLITLFLSIEKFIEFNTYLH